MPKTNIINAIHNLTQLNSYNLKDPTINPEENRMNFQGITLEFLIKDLLAGTINTNNEKKAQIYNQIFSHQGSANHPPDLMIRKGPAIEVKKISNLNSDLALNSSYPKQFLKADSLMITQSCREAEDWISKDLIYSVGVIDSKNNLKNLCFIYGDCYAAKEDTYSQIKTTITKGIESLPNIEAQPTNEIGRLNKIDPLEITNLRIRGMWTITNPYKTFEDIYQPKEDKNFNFFAILNTKIYNAFNNKELLNNIENLKITQTIIKDPDNPTTSTKEIILITYFK